MIHPIFDFLIHWILFCFVINVARWTLLSLHYPIKSSIKDLIALTAMLALLNGISHMIDFIFVDAVKEYATSFFNNL